MALWSEPVSGGVSQEYGIKNSSYAAGYHTGIDYSVPAGTPVGAAAKGTVVQVGGPDGAYGNYIIIRHPNGMFSLYAHLKRTGVKQGDKVGEGEQIALSGNTGNSTGDHLHFEIREGRGYGSDVNPVSFFGGKQVAVHKDSDGNRKDGKKDSGPDSNRTDQGTFGYVKAFLKDHPAVKALVEQAQKEGWTELKLAGEIKDTAWWKNRTEAQRQWDLISAESPAQADDLIDDQADALKAVFGTLGVRLSNKELKDLSKRAAVNGWDESEMRAAAAKRFELARPKNEQAVVGQAGDTLEAIENMMWEYGVKIDRGTKEKWIKRVLRGELDISTMEDRLREQAKVMFPTLKDELNNYTTRELMSPYLMVAAEELGLPPEQMETFDPKWMKPLTGKKDGGRMDMDEWTTHIRTNKKYGWDTTSTARQEAANLALELGRLMGAV